MTDHNDSWNPPPRIFRNPSADAPTAAFASAGAPATERISVPAPARTFETQAPPIILRRARPAVFIAPQPEQGVLVARDVGVSRGPTKTSELSRNRKIAGNLPDWDPLPPGEIRVVSRRPSGGL